MRLLWINPISREVTAIEGDPEQLIGTAILPPQGMVDLDKDTGLVVCPIGVVGNDVALWWSHELAEVFGGNALVVGITADDQLTSVPEGTWLRLHRTIEFLGNGDKALARLRELVGGAMGEGDPDPRQGVLALEPSNDLSRR